MTQTIWKYTLEINDHDQCVVMPLSSTVLKTHIKGSDIYLWALVHPEQQQEKRHFRVFGTGHAIPLTYTYLDTVQSPPFVWHIFEKRTPAQTLIKALLSLDT